MEKEDLKPFVPLPPEFTRIQNIMKERTDQEMERVYKQTRDAQSRHADIGKALNQCTTEFIATGIGRRPDYESYPGWVSWNQRSYLQWDCYIRQLAKELHRPYVFLEGAANYWHTLVIEKRKYTAPLVSMFLLLDAQEKSFHRHHYSSDHPVAYNVNTVRWKFQFTGGPGRKVLEQWLELCRTDPGYRKALRLP